MNQQIEAKSCIAKNSRSFHSEIRSMTFHLISLCNPEGIRPWALPELNFITALILPDSISVTQKLFEIDKN